MLLISLMASNLLTDQFTVYQRTSFLFFGHTLTKTWPMDLLGRPSPLPVPLFSLCLSLTEAYGYALTTGD